MSHIARIKTNLALLHKKQDLDIESLQPLHAAQPPLSEAEIQAFEHHHRVHLPEGYRAFLTNIGNGSIGPYYGILPLDKSVHNYDLAADPDLLSKPFPLQGALDLFATCGEGEDFDAYFRRCKDDTAYEQRVSFCLEQYSSSRYSQGTLNVCEYGCGITFRLVVTGTERGTLWVDDRASDAGLFPLVQAFGTEDRVDFLAWYENWLDRVLAASPSEDDTEQPYGYFEYGLRDTREI